MSAPISNPINLPAIEAGADLSTHQYKFGVINSSGQVILNTGAGGVVDGVIQDDPDAAGKGVVFAYMGTSKLNAGGTVTMGDLIMSTAAGLGVTATTTNYFFGRALSSAASGEIFTLKISPMGYVP